MACKSYLVLLGLALFAYCDLAAAAPAPEMGPLKERVSATAPGPVPGPKPDVTGVTPDLTGIYLPREEDAELGYFIEIGAPGAFAFASEVEEGGVMLGYGRATEADKCVMEADKMAYTGVFVENDYMFTADVGSTNFTLSGGVVVSEEEGKPHCERGAVSATTWGIRSSETLECADESVADDFVLNAITDKENMYVVGNI